MNEKKILVVDDETTIRDMLETAFREDGYFVRSAVSAEEALAILDHEQMPVMFIDLGLELMDGFELCERIRNDRPNTIIYALTGYAKLFGPHEILEAGFDDCFAKPFSVNTLRQAVRKAFEKIALRQKPVESVIRRILIIDDEDRVREMLREMLESEGFEVLVAVNGEDGMQRLAEIPVDLVITDIIMPKKDGIETLMEINAAYPAVKLIAMSGGGGHYGIDIDFDIARKFGAPTLHKPFSRKELLKIIKEL